MSVRIVAGDSWGEINEPLALEHPALIPLFFFMFMMISLGCMNLILAVIVEAQLRPFALLLENQRYV